MEDFFQEIQDYNDGTFLMKSRSEEHYDPDEEEDDEEFASEEYDDDEAYKLPRDWKKQFARAKFDEEEYLQLFGEFDDDDEDEYGGRVFVDKNKEDDDDDYTKDIQTIDPRYHRQYHAHLPYDEQYNEYGRKIDFDVRRGNDDDDDDEAGGAAYGQHPEQSYFVPDVMDFSEPFPELPEAQANQVMPLAAHGPEIDDFMSAMIEHPTKYAEVKYERVHPESRRLPMPVSSSENRMMIRPTREWIKQHRGFVHVSVPKTSSSVVGGGAAVEDDDTTTTTAVADNDNLIRTTVANLFPDVQPSQVFPTGPHGAFVGFATKERAREARAQYLDDSSSPTTTTSSLPTVLLAKRDKVFRTFAGWAGEHVVYKKNYTLVVEGDVPTSKFFLSHFDVLHVQVVRENDNEDDHDQLLTKQALTRFFQPLCQELRDPHGSVELLGDGHAAFVGFDRWGEADEVLQALTENKHDTNTTTTTVPLDEALSGYRTYNNETSLTVLTTTLPPDQQPHTITTTIRIQKVLEQALPYGTKLGPRGNRTEAQILDHLQNWEQYVDPDHLQELYDHEVVTKETLDEMFLKLRYDNPSMGPVDLALKGERLEPRVPIGARWPNTVRMYVKLLRDNITTPENPGQAVEHLFMPGEKVDIEIIDGPPGWRTDNNNNNAAMQAVGDK